MNKLNAGDKVICIKERFNPRRNCFNHIKGKTYFILNYKPLRNDGTGFENYKITSESCNNTHFSVRRFDTYFMTIKEYRKEKLEKLNEI